MLDTGTDPSVIFIVFIGKKKNNRGYGSKWDTGAGIRHIILTEGEIIPILYLFYIFKISVFYLENIRIIVYGKIIA